MSDPGNEIVWYHCAPRNGVRFPTYGDYLSVVDAGDWVMMRKADFVACFEDVAPLIEDPENGNRKGSFSTFPDDGEGGSVRREGYSIYQDQDAAYGYQPDLYPPLPGTPDYVPVPHQPTSAPTNPSIPGNLDWPLPEAT